jgi:hypothetical protein
VVGKAVIFCEHGSNAALGPSAGTVTQRPLGDHRHPMCWGEAKGRTEASESAADNQNIKRVFIHKVTFVSGSRGALMRWQHVGLGVGQANVDRRECGGLREFDQALFCQLKHRDEGHDEHRHALIDGK